LFAGSGVAHASTFVVNDSSDAVDSVPGNNACLTAGNKCTLRAAVQEADQHVGADTITLPMGTYTRTIGGADGADPAATGDLDITDTTGSLTIIGAGQSTTTVDAAGLERGFDVLPGAAASISGLTIKNGSASDPTPYSRGGGIRVGAQPGGAATATLTDVTITANHAALGAGALTDAAGSNLTLDRVSVLSNGGGPAREGGGVDENGGTITIRRSTVSGNSSAAGAGVTDDGGGTVDIVDSTVSNNHADPTNGHTGGVFETGGGKVTILRSTVSGNTAPEAGGVSEDGGGTLNVIDSTIRGNSATGSQYLDAGGLLRDASGTVRIQGSAIINNNAAQGAGIVDFGGAADGPFTIVNSTISGNRATSRGGGIHAEGDGTMSLNNVTLSGNVAATGAQIDNCSNVPNCTAAPHNIVLKNTIVAGGPACFGPINSAGNNLFGDTTCGMGAAGDIIGANPMLSSPANNGGPTFTAAELDGSPAIDRGAPATCAATDQRGVARPQGSRCDIGAFERRPAGPPPPKKCTDRISPVSRPDRRRSRVDRSGIVARGRSRDAGCHTNPATPADRGGVAKVRISVTRQVRGRCRVLRRDGSFGPRADCLRARLYAFTAIGTANWRLRLRFTLPRGLYRIFAKATDRRGNTERFDIRQRNGIKIPLR